MPSAMCNFGAANTGSAYAVQNASLTENVTFQVTYTPGGTLAGPYTLAPGAKRSVLGCEVLPPGFLGAAIIQRTAGAGSLVAVLKVSDQAGISAATLGNSSGASRIALSYVRWSPTSTYQTGARQRSFIAIQNVGTSDATNLRIHYINRDGTTVGTHTISAPWPPEPR